MRVRLRPTIAADVPQVVAIPLPYRIRAITAVADEDGAERVLGIGGLGYRPDGSVIGFAIFTDELRKYPMAIHRAGLAGMAMVREAGVPLVIAEAEDNNPAAEPWLIRLGFRRCGDVYVWEPAADVE